MSTNGKQRLERPSLEGLSKGRVVGYVEHVSRRLVEGWLDADAETAVALFIDGVERMRVLPHLPRPDAVSLGWSSAKGYRFYPAACRLTPGLHVVEVISIVRGVPSDHLPGVGIPDTVFEIEIPVPNLGDPGLFDYLLREHGSRPEIRRVLIADVRVKYRPGTWAGDVIFVDGLPDSPSSRYRVRNIQDELVELGFDCCTLTEDELWRLAQGDYSARVVHFFRAPMTGAFADAAMAARGAGARIGFDIDDLAFDPAIMPYIDGLRELSSDAIALYRVGMLDYARFAAFADFVTTTTECLAERLRGMASSVSVVPNSIAGALFRNEYGQAPRGGDCVFIGYYAGTRTHQVDFAVAADALVRILHGYPNVRIRLVGEIDISEFPRLAVHADRIEQSGLLAYEDMLRDMARCDITIAPLELDNPYCEAKSELKYFEATLTGSVVVASPTAPFVAAIDNGRTGFLATTTADWFQAFVRLLDDPELVARLNAVARDDVRRRYHAATVARRFAEVAQLLEPQIEREPQQPIAPASRRDGGARLDIGFVMPPLMIGSGGQRKVLRICHDLEQMGHAVSIYVMGARSPMECRELVTRHYYPFTGRLFRYNGTVASHDFLVATAWETAYVVRRHVISAGEPIYFVQDFEPLFMPMGTGYLKALATYMFGFRTICLGHWVADRLHREVGFEPATIPFTLDRVRYRPIPGTRRKEKSVLLFARPSQERRAFALATEALEMVAHRAPAVQIGFFGERDYPAQRFSFANHGLLQSGEELAELYRGSTVGVCLSPTNPSLVAYEMLACGTPLVDLALPRSAINFAGMDVAYLAMPTPESLAEQMLLALQDDERRTRRIMAGIELTSGMDFDESMAKRFASLLRETSPKGSAVAEQLRTSPGSAASVRSGDRQRKPRRHQAGAALKLLPAAQVAP